ncbi:hypothetical protein Ancab_001408 [Ancistrocladus abbreviatus]
MELSDHKVSTPPTTGVNTPPQVANAVLSSPISLSSPQSSPPPLAPSPPPPAHVILSPCAACKILRRRCADKCVLAPYFPPTDPLKFTIAHKVFGASNIIKMLQELPECQRADAVSSMVYEANARLRDPIYGCAGAICHLQKQVNELQAELAKAKAEIMNMQLQQANLVAFICMEISPQPTSNYSPPPPPLPPQLESTSSASFLNFYDDSCNLSSTWDPLWA